MSILVSEPELLSSGHGLLEAPLWHPQLGLLAADASVGGVWRFSFDESAQVVVPHRRGIGGMALHIDGGVVVGGRNIAYKALQSAQASSDTIALLQNDPARGVVGFNDLTTDAAGRIYVGSLGFVPMHGETADGKPGALHVIDLDGSSRVVAKDVALSNGLGFSPDGTRLYHADSARHLVRCYEVLDTGELSAPTVFARVTNGLPDGLAIDAAGVVWVAVAHGNAVIAFSPQGVELARIRIPVPMVTSLCFGGPDLRDLYVFTGSEGSPKLNACIFHVRAEVPGLPIAAARVRLGSQ